MLSQVETYEDKGTYMQWDAGPIHELLVCPVCSGVSLRRYSWHDMMDPDEIVVEIVYPLPDQVPAGLPPKIQSEFEAALLVRQASPNAYGVLLGRLLELVCDERGAIKGSLTIRLKDLCERGEIPAKLVEVATALENLRHVGAHAWIGELTAAEVPILDNLCKALLEYVYGAPHLVEEAGRSLLQVRKSPPRGQKPATENA